MIISRMRKQGGGRKWGEVEKLGLSKGNRKKESSMMKEGVRRNWVGERS
jgi:hypothetical protein